MTDEEIRENVQFASGCYYWADVEEITKGYMVHVRDDAYGYEASHEVTFEDLRDAFARIVRGTTESGRSYQIVGWMHEYFYRSIMNGENGGIDFGDIDTDAADAWMQIALFDHIVYS